ncbi:tryptophan-rich sensory protein [Virgibacillus chiguensis]|uniref:TspO/MBR family protein n=1 Tax=Virgibacillus chiguensis TaxID=411959 RepID=A0A1M5RLF3_9BACI|nr:tryptophan-rich sensory protein [Virgibacillus chiguensis]SHH26653.1 TspO/MBR family protein [Virgibacillus chiguensis]
MKTSKYIIMMYLIFFAMMVGINYFAGSNVGQIANQYETLIQPAGYAFAIWGVIYLFLFIWIIRGFFIQGDKATLYKEFQFVLPINFVLNSLWILTFTRDNILLSTIIILLLLGTLIWMYRVVWTISFSRLLDRIPFSIYFGWVSLASVVNLFTYAKSEGITSFLGLSEFICTVIVILLVTGIAARITLRNQDLFLPLVYIWTFIAIYVKDQQQLLQFTLLLCCLVLVVCFVFIAIRKMKKIVK